MNIETLNNVIGNTLNRVIEKAIDSIGALPVGSKYKLFGSNPFTLLVQRTAFGDYPEVIFQDIKTGKDFFILKDISKKSKQDFKSKLFRHINSTSEIVQNIANEKDSVKDWYFKQVNTTVNKFVNNIISELKEEKKGKKTTLKKKTTSKSSKKINRKINPDKVGFLVKTMAGGKYITVPKSSLTIYKNEKLPDVKLFITKLEENRGWTITDLMSGKSLAVDMTKKGVIERADEIIDRVGAEEIKKKLKEFRLPKEQLDIVMQPYKLYSKSKVSKTTTPKKQTIKKTVKAKPKKVSSSIETCSDAGRILRIKKSSAAGRKLAVCRWN